MTVVYGAGGGGRQMFHLNVTKVKDWPLLRKLAKGTSAKFNAATLGTSSSGRGGE